jgi:dipeptidyl aminopeptidase/acylaminoacyl peptidase
VSIDEELRRLLDYDDSDVGGRLAVDRAVAAGRRRRARQRVLVVASSSAVVIVLAALGASGLLQQRSASPTPGHPLPSTSHAPSPSPVPRTVAPRPGSNPSQEFLTTQHSGPLALAVDVRSLGDARVLQELPIPAGDLPADATEETALRAPDGTIVAVASGGCYAQISRVDPKTGAVTLLHDESVSVEQPVLSPDGTRLAYLTWGYCLVPAHGVVQQPGGLAEVGPTQLSILDLATGATVDAPALLSGDDVDSMTWSPDGSKLAVSLYSGNITSLYVLSSTHPVYAGSQHMHAPAGCEDLPQAWTSSGLYAVQYCQPAFSTLSPERIVRLDQHGFVTGDWALPPCINGMTVTADAASRTRLLVAMDVGYGSDACGAHWSYRISELTGSGLRTLLDLPGSDGTNSTWDVTSW